jgi:eukaryotic-like serine/threonine-protein kinase
VKLVETGANPALTWRFGVFEVNARDAELRRSGRLVKMREQSFRILILLLEHAGELVTREDLRRVLWPSDTFVDFDHSLNTAMMKLREVLGDSAEAPLYIETIPKRGYRFIAPVTEVRTAGFPESAIGDLENSTNEIAGTETVASEAQNRAKPARSKIRLIGVVVFALAAIAIGVVVLFFHRSNRILTEKDKIVLADFTNSTGDPVFDGTLRQGMAVQLEQSPFLSLVSDERIHQMLGMMGQPADARLTPEVVRQICQRTASAAVLSGSIASLGSQYVLTLRAENCQTGDVLDEEQAQASRKEDVLNALSHMASRLRTRLGESLATIQKYDTSLEEATTPSLEALKAYSTGWQVSYSTGSAAAMPFFQRAIEIDPKFAMAHASLGRMYGDIGESTLSAQSTVTAYQLRERANDEERFFIAASYDKQVTGNLEKAEQTCELWIQSYPRAITPHGFLSGNISLSRGNYDKSIDEAKIVIGLDPDVAIIYSNLALSYVALGQIDKTEDVLRQASNRKLEMPDFPIQRYAMAFLKGDIEGMDREAAQSREKPEDWMSNAESFVLAYSGRLEEARKMSRRAVDLAQIEERRDTQAQYETDSALREALFGNASMARQRAIAALALSNSRDVEYAAAFALAVSGDDSRSQALASDLSRRFPEDTKVRFIFVPALRALLALHHGQPAKAVELLQIAIPYESGILSSGGSEVLLGTGNLYPAYVRGEAYLAARQGPQAAAEFRKILDRRGITVTDPIGALAHLQLGHAYALAGENEKARGAYKDFLALWKDADPEIPTLKRAMEEYAKLP